MHTKISDSGLPNILPIWAFSKDVQQEFWGWSTYAGFEWKLNSWSKQPNNVNSLESLLSSRQSKRPKALSVHVFLPFPQSKTVDGVFRMNWRIPGSLIPWGAKFSQGKSQTLPTLPKLTMAPSWLPVGNTVQQNSKGAPTFKDLHIQVIPILSQPFFPGISKFTERFRREELQWESVTYLFVIEQRKGGKQRMVISESQGIK